MTMRRERDCEARDRSFGGFLKSLLHGIPWSERAEREETVTVDAPKAGQFRVHNPNGRTRITGEDRSDIQVAVHKSARAESAEAAEGLLDAIQLVFHDTEDGLDLEVETPQKWNRRGLAHLCIRLPRDLQVAVAASNGRIEIKGLRGGVRARSTNGSACIADVVGDVQVTTSNAKVSCSCICGKLTARSSNGKIEIEQQRGGVDASTSNGLIRASFDAVGPDGIQLATSNGRIVIDLPDPVDADLDARVDNGVIRNERQLDQTSRESNGRLVGRLGHGGALIKLRTSNGSISVR